MKSIRKSDERSRLTARSILEEDSTIEGAVLGADSALARASRASVLSGVARLSVRSSVSGRSRLSTAAVVAGASVVSGASVLSVVSASSVLSGLSIGSLGSGRSGSSVESGRSGRSLRSGASSGARVAGRGSDGLARLRGRTSGVAGLSGSSRASGSSGSSGGSLRSSGSRKTASIALRILPVCLTSSSVVEGWNGLHGREIGVDSIHVGLKEYCIHLTYFLWEIASHSNTSQNSEKSIKKIEWSSL